MLVAIFENKPSNPVAISDPDKEQEFLVSNPTYIQTDFKFAESVDLYEYDGTTFNLIENWETIKADRLEARRIANLPTFEELQTQMIATLHKNYDAQFDAYLAQYPKGEQTSFEDKASEAKAYHADNTVDTPIISAMVGGDETLRVEMLEAVWVKLIGIAQMEGQMVAKRDAIKACTTVEELEAIEI